MYQLNNYDFLNHPVELKNNAYDNNWVSSTVSETFATALTYEHIDKCKLIAHLLYEINPDVGYLYDEDSIFEKRDQQESKLTRREIMPMVRYNLKSNYSYAIVVLDLDFKVDLDSLKASTYKSLNECIIEFFKQHKAAIFLVKSTSGLGFHIGFAVQSDLLTDQVYSRAYSNFSTELTSFMNKSGFNRYIDPSVNRIESQFFIGELMDINFLKNPIYTYFIANTEKKNVEIKNEHTISSLRAEFLLTHYSKLIPANCTAFNDYDDWIRMIYALVSIFKHDRERAYYWFNYLSDLCLPETNKYENDYHFDNIFERDDIDDIGVNYILAKIFGSLKQMPQINYTLNDVEVFWEKQSRELNTCINTCIPGEDNPLIIQNYISERVADTNLNENLLIVAPPNSGKTTFFMNCDDIVLLTPTSILRDDIHSSNPDSYKITAGKDVPTEKLRYIGNYDAIYKLGKQHSLSRYTLVIDEAHELFLSANPEYRYDVVKKITDMFCLFKNVILLTGTPLPFQVPGISIRQITFIKENPSQPILKIIETGSPLSSLIDDIMQTNGKQIIYINNKKQIAKVEAHLLQQDPTRNVLVFTSETREDIAQQEFLKNNTLPENTVVIGTRIILEGISFLDNNIAALRFYQPTLAEYIAQFSFRPRRTSEILICLYCKPKGYRIITTSDLNFAYKMEYAKALDQKSDLSNFSRIMQTNYFRYYSKSKKGKLIPMPLIECDKVELDHLFIGNLACAASEILQSVDLMSMLLQLKRWNFKYQFEKRGKSDTLKNISVESLENQKEIIIHHFQHFSTLPTVAPSKKLLYRAFVINQFLSPGFLDGKSGEERLEIVENKSIYAKLILAIAMWAIENDIHEPLLKNELTKHALDEAIQIISTVKKSNEYPRLTHKQIIEYSGLEPSLIKRAKKALGLYFDYDEGNTNGDRYVVLTYSDRYGVSQWLNIDRFDKESDSPF